MLVTKGRFARVCVEIDLTKPLVAKFWLDKRWYSVEYEGLHLICYKCGRYGHGLKSCPFVQNQVGDKSHVASEARMRRGTATEAPSTPPPPNAHNQVGSHNPPPTTHFHQTQLQRPPLSQLLGMA